MSRPACFMPALFLFFFLPPSHGNAGAAEPKVAEGDSVKMIRMTGGDAFSIPELAAIVVKEGKDLKVQFVSPANNRPEKYKQVDLRVDDLILLANGRRVKTIAELEKAHAATETGSEFKLGIQRGQEMMIVAFSKGDPKDLPKTQMRIVRRGGEDGTEVLPAVGVVLEEREHKVVIHEVLPMENTAVKGLDVKAGDIIAALNGAKVTSVRSFVSSYDKIEVGAKIVWATERKGKAIEISFAKPKPMGGMIMRKEMK